ncbi:MAG: hypothetical protein QXW04_01455 [Candidatus Aenigmatarchaeota archaeon]
MKEKKQLFRVKLLASEEFENKEISDTFCSDYSFLVNRRFCLNLSELIDTNKFQYKIWFRIFKVENGIAYSKFDGVETLRERIYSAIFPGVKVIRVYVNAITKDKIPFRFKFVLTFKRIRGKQEKAIRKIIEENLNKIVSELTIKELINNMIIKNTILKKLEKEIRKIAIPLFFEIIKIERKEKLAAS